MGTLDQDLRERKNSLDEFFQLTIRLLNYLPDVLNNKKVKNGYTIHSSNIASTIKYIRPLNQRLFIYNSTLFKERFNNFQDLFGKLSDSESMWDENEKEIIDSVLYTIQQSIGAGFDLLVNPNSSRKHVGNRFEELIRVIFTEIGVPNKRTVLQIPYETDEGIKTYKCENDLILSPYKNVKSTNKYLDQNEIVVAAKTTSKDRMGKMFIDKILLERFVKHNQKVIAIFLNDVQRKKSDNIGFTLVSGLFMVYTKFLTQLDGVYYLDPPPNAYKTPYNKYINSFSELITKDIWKLLSS